MKPLVGETGKILLQESIDAALNNGEILDLDGKAWTFFAPVVANGDIRIRNGYLIFYRPVPYPDADPVTGLVEEMVAIQINGTPELVDFELYRGGGPAVVGMDIEGAVDFRSVRCRWDRFRSGGGIGLRLSGVQMARFDMPGFWENDTHFDVRTLDGGTWTRASTDIRMLTPTMTTAICSNNAPAMRLEGIGNMSVWGGSIENARDGNLVHASACKGLSFRSTRFEKVGKGTPGKYSHLYLTNGCELPIIDDCSFDNTIPNAAGVYVPIIGSDGTESHARTRDCRLPLSSPTVREGSKAIDSGSKNFSGDKLSGLREMFGG